MTIEPLPSLDLEFGDTVPLAVDLDVTVRSEASTMERMPYRSDTSEPAAADQPTVANRQQRLAERLPVLTGEQVTLRELRTVDAASLFALLTTEEVARFISPPPTTVEGFERFIAWTHAAAAAGAYACFAVTLDGFDTAIGIFQVRQLEPGFGTAEWGFAIGSAFWGTGVFQEGAELVLEFAFDTSACTGSRRARRSSNGRGNGALRKIGAVQEGMLRKSFLKNGEYLDQALWAILDEDWKAKTVWSGKEVMILH